MITDKEDIADSTQTHALYGQFGTPAFVYHYIPCAHGHTILWAGEPDYKIPAGYPCECGLTCVTYETCPHCGHEKLVMKGGSA